MTICEKIETEKVFENNKMNKIFKQLIQWGIAFVIAFFLMNLLTFAFYNPCQELAREHGATTSLLLPNSRGVYGLEGYCLANVDDNGYVNRSLPRADSYYLVAGASHTEGLFIPLELRYSDLLGGMLGEDGQLKVYNIGRSGNFFSVVLQHLDGILGEFPDAQAIIIETDTLTYDSKALYDSQVQAGFEPEENAQAMLSGLSGKQRLLIQIKKYLPLTRELRKQYYTWKDSLETGTSDILDPEFWEKEFAGEFPGALSELMKFIRSKTDKQVIILYHPAVSIERDGSMKLLTNGAEPYYKEICPEYDIDFVDMSDAFMKAYNEEYIVPRGFHNTTPGDGHVNRAAHRMMAEELYKVIRGKE